jgi:hypothetical protein
MFLLKLAYPGAGIVIIEHLFEPVKPPAVPPLGRFWPGFRPIFGPLSRPSARVGTARRGRMEPALNASYEYANESGLSSSLV